MIVLYHNNLVLLETYGTRHLKIIFIAFLET